MEKKKICLLILLFFTLLILLVSFATKGAHWEYRNDRVISNFDSASDVYHAMEGVIVLDVFLFVLFIVVTVLTFKPNPNIFKVIAIIIIVLLVIRFIVSLVFLAGSDNYCKKIIDNYNNWSAYQEAFMKKLLGNLNYFQTLKGAWAWEIITCILLYVFSGVTLFLVKGIDAN